MKKTYKSDKKYHWKARRGTISRSGHFINSWKKEAEGITYKMKQHQNTITQNIRDCWKRWVISRKPQTQTQPDTLRGTKGGGGNWGSGQPVPAVPLPLLSSQGQWPLPWARTVGSILSPHLQGSYWSRKLPHPDVWNLIEIKTHGSQPRDVSPQTVTVFKIAPDLYFYFKDTVKRTHGLYKTLQTLLSSHTLKLVWYPMFISKTWKTPLLALAWAILFHIPPSTKCP